MRKVYSQVFKAAFFRVQFQYTVYDWELLPDAMFFEDLEGAHAALDVELIPWLRSWPNEALHYLGENLRVLLRCYYEGLSSKITPSAWEQFDDEVDAFYGYVWRQVFEPAGWNLADMPGDCDDYEFDHTELEQVLGPDVTIPDIEWSFDRPEEEAKRAK